jgi:hypothetical protein
LERQVELPPVDRGKDVEPFVDLVKLAADIGQRLDGKLRPAAFGLAGEKVVEHRAAEIGHRFGHRQHRGRLLGPVEPSGTDLRPEHFLQRAQRDRVRLERQTGSKST